MSDAIENEVRLEAFLGAGRVTLDALFAWFDALDAVPWDAMLGEWSGGVFDTGHPGEKQLAGLGWVGKRFHGPQNVDPIITLDADGRRVANPVLGEGCLRSMTHRGITTATLIYDRHPIFDHFRRISPDAVLGVMDRKGDDMPLFFFLRRIP